MDDIVKAAMAKWPSVPHCYGWLGLDARGNWYMRDDRAQAAGAFASGQSQAKGSLLKHDKLIAFIARNYLVDASAPGQWFFQNGPQRVYVELEATPLIWRVEPDFSLVAHHGAAAAMRSCWLDEEGRLYADTPVGFGLVHTQDMWLAAEAVEQGLWQPQELGSAQLPARFGFVRSPQAAVLASAVEEKKAGH